jgi:hypothetical protein
MTEWNGSTVRHIPEEELHAYLDQALSRSQCVEIERHLARCRPCRLERDAIAGLRDRTTELLARVGPPAIFPPAFEVLRGRAAERAGRRWRWMARAAWAASLVGAMAAGWQVNRRLHGPAATPSLAQAPAMLKEPELAASPVELPTNSSTRPAHPARATGQPLGLRQLVRVPPAAEVRFVRAVEAYRDTFAAPEGTVAVGSIPFDAAPPSAQPVIADPGLQGLWRTIIPDSSSLLRSGDIALVPGLPVTQMRVQPGAGSSSVTAVDQVLESGDVIRTIAGPATRVGSLVDEDTTDGTDSATDRSGGLMTVTIRQGDRMVAVTGPSQALGSLLSRVNVKRRRY